MGRVRTPTAHKRIVLSDRGQHRRSPRGIRVNAVAPGFIDTDMPRFRKTEEGRATVIGMQALQRIAEPEDAASVIAFSRRTKRAGSPATRSASTAAPSSEDFVPGVSASVRYALANSADAQGAMDAPHQRSVTALVATQSSAPAPGLFTFGVCGKSVTLETVFDSTSLPAFGIQIGFNSAGG